MPSATPSAPARSRWLGPDALELPELLGLVLGRAKGSWRALEGVDLNALARANPAELERELALRPVEAQRLAAAFALGRRAARFARPPRRAIRTARQAVELFGAELAGLRQERMHAVALDGRHVFAGRYEVSRGTLTASLVHPREVYRPALARGAAALIVLHNHPSGNPEPSHDDLAVTRRLIEAGRLLGVALVDHVVVGADCFVSLRERMPWGNEAADSEA